MRLPSASVTVHDIGVVLVPSLERTELRQCGVDCPFPVGPWTSEMGRKSVLDLNYCFGLYCVPY